MSKKNMESIPAFFNSGNLFDPANYEDPQFGPDDLIVNPQAVNERGEQDAPSISSSPKMQTELPQSYIDEIDEANRQEEDQPLSAAERYRQILDNYRERVKGARGDRSRTNLMAGLSDAANTIAAGMAAGYGGQIRDPKTGDMLRRNAAERASDVESDLRVDLSGLSGEQKFVKSDMDLQNEKELNNPDSAISDIYRKTAKMLAPGIDDEALNKATAAQLAQAIPGLQTYANARLRQEMNLDRINQQNAMLNQRQDEESRRKLQQEVNFSSNFLKQDPRYKKAIEQKGTYREVENLINEVGKEQNQAALAALGTKLARAMGEVGVLTDADVVRYLGSRSWGRKINEWVKGGMKGTLPDDSIQELRKNLDFFKKETTANIDDIYDNAEKRLYDVYKGEMPMERVKQLVGPRPFSTMSEDSEKAQISEKDRQALQWAQSNPDDERSKKIIEKLRKQGKI